ncbi:MAG: DUF262 domain-containing protein [Tardiphaga sp.]|nr:DUF262 domain-containing protein [Tardiphaga sp.]
MEARPCPIIDFFNGTKQMVVPLFQRSYEWGPREWQAQWEDLLEQYERTEQETVASHFTGAIVTAPAKSVPIGVSKFLVIDGQQRLTTIALFLCALRSFFEKTTPKYRKLTSLLVNEYDEGADYYKLLPTQLDRSAFKSIIDNEEGKPSRFMDAFEYYQSKISGADSDGQKIDLDRMADTIQSRLTVVAIHLGDADDPYLIFESLNAKGAPLTQADLIRNYLLLRLHAGEQQKAYELSWLPMQSLLVGDNLTEFMRQYLMLPGDEVGKSSIYAVLKSRLAKVHDGLIADELLKMQKLSIVYAQIIGLIPFPQVQIDRGLGRLRRWEVATANVILLKLLRMHRDGEIVDADIIDCIRTLESFVVRRAICGVPTNQLKRIFLAVAKELPEEDVPAWLTENLAAGTAGRRWPKNEELHNSLLRYRAYSQPLDRCKFLLEALEQDHKHKELASFVTASIEHIMPQTLTDEWREMLGPDADDVHERHIDLLGNLTLTGYNSELSNFPFSKKKELFDESHFELNKWVTAQDKWTDIEIGAQSNMLFERVKIIWSRPAME